MDLTKLSKPALAAAMKGGTAQWGERGSSRDHVRYMEPTDHRRCKCRCGCNGRATHRGMANGISLTEGCELTIARWVKTGHR